MDVVTEAKLLGLRWGRADGVIVSRAAFVAETRTWIDTWFAHQQELKGVGVDCGGLIRGASVALGLLPADYKQRMPRALAGYSRQANDDTGRRLCDHYWTRIDESELQPGDVVIVGWGRGAQSQHAAVVANHPLGGLSIIHAWARARPRGRVLEQSFSWARRDHSAGPSVHAAYSIPGVA